jgi:rhodanese-related sulfurtransferase
MKKFLSLLLCFVGLASVSFANYADISTEDLKKAIADGKVTLLDVNGSDSYKAGHIPGAIDFTAHKADIASKLPADKGALIVAYCGNEKCGAYKAGAAAAEKLGYTNVKHYSKGIQGWKKMGEKTDAAH